MRPPPGGLFYLEDFVAGPTVFNQDPNTTTLAQAQAWLEAESKGSKGANCPCCQKKDRIYGRKVTAVQAAVLVMLYRTYRVGDVVQLQDFVVSLNNPNLMRGREWGRLVHWDLLENTESEKHYRLCEGGFFFVFKGHKITEKAWIRDNTVVARDGKIVDLAHVLKDKFDLNQLLAAQTPPSVQTAVQS